MASGPSSSSGSFVHLHVHTEYSMLDGAARIDDLLAPRRRELGMPALAITDHGYLFGAYEFWKKAKKHGVKPIIGIEAYLTPGTQPLRPHPGPVGRRRQAGDDVSGGGAYTHMTLLARDDAGHAQPLPDRLAGLARGPLLQAPDGPRAARDVRRGAHRDDRLPVGRGPDPAAARAVRRGAARPPREFRDIFGRENFYVELMDHGLEHRAPGPEGPAAARQGPRTCRWSPPTTCTTRAPEDAQAHEALLCVQSGSTLADPEPVQVRRRRRSTSSRPQRDARTCGASSPRPATTRC